MNVSESFTCIQCCQMFFHWTSNSRKLARKLFKDYTANVISGLKLFVPLFLLVRYSFDDVIVTKKKEKVYFPFPRCGRCRNACDGNCHQTSPEGDNSKLPPGVLPIKKLGISWREAAVTKLTFNHIVLSCKILSHFMIMIPVLTLI